VIALEGHRNLFVLLGANGAGRIDDPSTVAHVGQGLFQNPALKPGKSSQLALVDPEARIGSAPQDPQFRAGRVDQGDAGAEAGGRAGSDLDPGAGPLRAQSEALQALCVRIARDEPAFPAQVGGEGEALPPGARAGVEYRFAGPRLTERRDELAALVLHLEEPRAERAEREQIRSGRSHDEPVRRQGRLDRFDALVSQAHSEVAPRGAERIRAQADGAGHADRFCECIGLGAEFAREQRLEEIG